MRKIAIIVCVTVLSTACTAVPTGLLSDESGTAADYNSQRSALSANGDGSGLEGSSGERLADPPTDSTSSVTARGGFLGGSGN